MVPRPIEFHPSAVDEAEAARIWYSEIHESLGEAFADEMDASLDRVARNPERWARHLHGTRGYLLRRFPFMIVYRLHEDCVQVIAI